MAKCIKILDLKVWNLKFLSKYFAENGKEKFFFADVPLCTF